MNTRKSIWLKLFCIAIIPLMFTVGCAKRDAQKAQALAQQARDEASAAQAPGYVPKAFNDAMRLFTQAEQQFAAGSYKESIDSYQQAQGRFQSAAEGVKTVKPRIDALIAKIEESLGKATGNLEKARSGGEVVPAEEIAPVQTIVDTLSQRMESEIRSEVDEEKLNAFLAEVDQAVAQTDTLALAHLKPQAATAKQEIQTLIARAQELKADTNVSDQYAPIMEKFALVESAEQEGQWQKMIDLSGELKEPLNQIIQVSQEKAAGDILNQVNGQIAQAKQLNIQGIDAFASAIQRAESAIQSGQTSLQSQDFSGAITATDQAKAALREAYQAVGQQSQQLIDASKANLQKSIDQEAEKYASSVVAQVREAIAGAEELLKAESYVKAFSAAQTANRVSNQAIDAGRRGKAQLELDKVEQPFSILSSQGGAQYAPEAYKQALTLVQGLRDRMKSGEFESIPAGIPEAVTAVDAGLDALSESSGTYIVQAEKALEEAKASGAPEWVGVQYANAANLKSAAEKNQIAKKFLDSLRNAEASVKIAKDAEARAYQLQTDQNLRKVDEFLVLAKRAEQDRLSPLAYRQALESRENALGLLRQNQHKDAFLASNEALKKADRAFNNSVVTAKEKNDSAVAANAMDYSPAEIQQALVLLTQAEDAQKVQNFSAANELSIQSIQLAEKAEDVTWKQRSIRLLSDLEGSKEELEAQLAPVKAPAQYQQCLANLADAKVEQINQNYKASYDYAAQADEAKNAAWETMNADLTQTLTEMKETSDWIGQNALDPQGREIKLGLIETIPELERQIALKDWPAAYAAAEKCEKVAGRARGRLEQRNRSIMSKNLKESVNLYERQGVLSIVPEQKSQIKDAFKTFIKPAPDETYTDVFSKYENASGEVVNMPTTVVSHAKQRTDEIASILQQAEEAGASKFYKDWYRDLSSDLQMLRNAVRGENLAEIASYVRKLDREAPRLLVATQQAADEDEYLSELEKNLNQMNNVFQEFGFLGSIPKTLLITSRLTEHKLDKSQVDMFKAMQGTMSVNTLRVNAELLEDNVIGLKPPKTLTRIHKKALESFKNFRKSAEAFEIYGEGEAHDIHYRDKVISNGYDCMQKSLKLNADILYEIKEARKLNQFDKFMYGVGKVESNVSNFYYNWQQ